MINKLILLVSLTLVTQRALCQDSSRIAVSDGLIHLTNTQGQQINVKLIEGERCDSMLQAELLYSKQKDSTITQLKEKIVVLNKQDSVNTKIQKKLDDIILLKTEWKNDIDSDYKDRVKWLDKKVKRGIGGGAAGVALLLMLDIGLHFIKR